MTLLVESPVMGLQKELMKRLAPSSRRSISKETPSTDTNFSIPLTNVSHQSPIVLPEYCALKTSDENRNLVP